MYVFLSVIFQLNAKGSVHHLLRITANDVTLFHSSLLHLSALLGFAGETTAGDELEALIYQTGEGAGNDEMALAAFAFKENESADGDGGSDDELSGSGNHRHNT